MSQVPSAEQMLSPGFSLLSVGAEDFTAIEGAVVELIKYVVALAVDGGGHREEGSADNVLSRIDVDEVVLQRFTRKIGTMYRHTPYHNFWHALCVSRECALIVKALHEWAQLESLRPTPPSLAPEHALSPGTDAVPPAPFFTARELFTIMVSALVHDGKLAADCRGNAPSLPHSLPPSISLSLPSHPPTPLSRPPQSTTLGPTTISRSRAGASWPSSTTTTAYWRITTCLSLFPSCRLPTWTSSVGGMPTM